MTTKATKPRAAAPSDRDFAGVRLQKILAAAGIGSRRHCEEYILAGRVTVDGRTVSELGVRVDPGTQDIRFDGQSLALEKKVFYIVNKPPGFISTNQDPAGRRRVIDLFPQSRERLFTVGRLDEESQGLMLVTNDGALAHRLAHPRFGVPKTYRVHVAGLPTHEALQSLRTGLPFGEGIFKVHSIRRIRTFGSSMLLEVVLMEGQNREIRRLLAKIGHKVMRLERIAFGPLKLDRLALGKFRPLSPWEIKQLHAIAEGRPVPRPKSRRPSTRGGRK